MGARPADAGLDRRSLSGPALRTFFRIAAARRLSAEEQKTLLGLTTRSTYSKWIKGEEAVLPKDTLERISYILGIYKALQILLPEPAAPDGWMRKANDAPTFAGKSALDRMLSGRVADLYVVRQYLDARRSGWA
jgi:hypothetical protein